MLCVCVCVYLWVSVVLLWNYRVMKISYTEQQLTFRDRYSWLHGSFSVHSFKNAIYLSHSKRVAERTVFRKHSSIFLNNPRLWCVCECVRMCVAAIGTDGQTNGRYRQTDKTNKQTRRQTDRQNVFADRQTSKQDWQIDRHKYLTAEMQTNKRAIQTDRQNLTVVRQNNQTEETDRHKKVFADRQTDKQTGHTDRQT